MKLINVGIKNNIPHIIKLGICEKDFFFNNSVRDKNRFLVI